MYSTRSASGIPAPKPTRPSHHHKPRYAFVHARWHDDIVLCARDGFAAQMQHLGLDNDAIDVFAVPGAFELPLHAKKLARSGRYDAVVACALVVDGGIYRHDFVAATVVDALMAVQLETEVPVLSVVLTPHHFQPHEAHQGFFADHFQLKGKEAANACHETVASLRTIAEMDVTASASDTRDADTAVQ